MTALRRETTETPPKAPAPHPDDRPPGQSVGLRRSAGAAQVPKPQGALPAWLVRPLAPLVKAVESWRERTGRPTLRSQLEVAGLWVSPLAFAVIEVALGVVGAAVGFLVLGWWGALGGLVVAFVVPRLVIVVRRSRRLHNFENQLPDGLLHLSNALKAGRPFSGAIQQVAEFASPPLSEEFARMASEIELGMAPVEAIRLAGRRLRSSEMDLVVAMVAIHESIGGDMSKSLENMSDTLEQRRHIREEAQAVTAQPRLTAIMVSLIPICLAAALVLIAPNYFDPMLRQPLGRAMLAGAAALIVLGDFIVLRLQQVRL